MCSINQALRYSTTGVGRLLDLPRPWDLTVGLVLVVELVVELAVIVAVM